MINNSVPVLVVDDVASMRNILSLMLNRLGFETVVTADDARQALQKLEQGDFGLVISDWQMEGMTGLELLNKTRETPELQNIPIILVSAQSSELNSAAAKSAGAQGYLVKPFRLEVLKSTIKEAFDLREAQELKKTGRIVYKGCALIPKIDHDGHRCHIFNGGTEMAALPANDSQQGAIDEAKLWVDQISLAPKPASSPAGSPVTSPVSSRPSPSVPERNSEDKSDMRDA
jgi:two-component system chemotaxis response regulator CheY